MYEYEAIDRGTSPRTIILEQLEERIVLEGAATDTSEVHHEISDTGSVDSLGWVYINNGWWYEDNGSGWWWEEATGWSWNENTGWWVLNSGDFSYWYHGEHQYWAHENSTDAWFWWDDIADQIWEPAFTWFADQINSQWMWVYHDWNGTQYYADDLHYLYQDHNGNVWWWFDAVNDAIWEPYQTWFVDSFGTKVFNDWDHSEYIWGLYGTFFTQQHTSSFENDAPIGFVPISQSMNEDVDLQMIPIQVYDVDSGSSPLQVTLSAAHGTLTLLNPGSIMFVTGDGSQDRDMIFQGTWAQLNAVLQGIMYRPENNFHGLDTLNFCITDLGNSGSGEAQFFAKEIIVMINQVNDAPVSNPISDIEQDEDFGTCYYDVSGHYIDVDSSSLTFSLGTVAYHDGLMLDNFSIDPNTGIISFTSHADSHGSMSLEVVASDGEFATSQTFTFTVNPETDTPRRVDDCNQLIWSNMVEFHGNIYFAQGDGNGSDLWVYEPGIGARCVVQDETSWGDGRGCGIVTSENGLFLFVNDGNGTDIWLYRPEIGAICVAQDETNWGNGRVISNFVILDDNLYFFAADSQGKDLWVYKPGVGASCVAQDEAYWGNNSSLRELTAAEGSLFFIAHDDYDDVWTYKPGVGASCIANGSSLWMSGRVEYLASLGDDLYFTAESSATNNLWTYRPGEGLICVARGNISWGGFKIADLTAVGDNLYFWLVEYQGYLAFYHIGGYQPGFGAALVLNYTDWGGGEVSDLTSFGDVLCFTTSETDLWAFQPGIGLTCIGQADFGPGATQFLTAGGNLYFTTGGNLWVWTN
ncbi:hypothetical protein [Desulfomonile tiedjei]|uniref:Cadherin domain-containing protein n=1 Tax=Desulfomonile tiedjei (strain ATCC 49306 / DSM 6799 / DCB-1) TaxID=706587 RepID=I4CDU1_DESTA|nr:hypothetical protein [Desulfomonile tiedjei]AFM27732.1 hypothetical protein Desti_5127 [Desulfomonile tiedjei DSM 6799]